MERELTHRSRMTLEPSISSPSHRDLHSEVFGWISSRLRQLPWRDVRDPWMILVSEIMLQQTSVNRVLGKWETFVRSFPSPSDCARAELGDVLRLWQGLGYPRRARNLHACARTIVEEFDGSVPSTVGELMGLPGVGPYTARAVIAFAFEGDAAVVDTNVIRVLRRWSGESLSLRAAQELADRLLPEGEVWLWNQAMMDLGATVCGPKPICDECPLGTSCEWKGHGSDPALTSTGSRQPRFEGSGRQARGRLMKALVAGSVSTSDVACVMDRSPEIARELVQALLDEGLIRRTGDVLHL